MQDEKRPELTLDFLRQNLELISDLNLSEEAEGIHELFAGLIAMMNTLQLQGYADVFPALTFRPVKE